MSPRLLPLALALVALAAAAGEAHHILGLPHYSYRENYPQVPTLEYPASTGPYDVLLTTYPGRPVPGEPTTLSFYVKDRTRSLRYDQPLTLRVLQTFTFGESKVVVPPTARCPDHVCHQFFVTFPTDGEFVVELTMDVEGKTEVIPFRLVAGHVSSGSSVLLALGAALGLFAIVVRALRIKRARRALAVA